MSMMKEKSGNNGRGLVGDILDGMWDGPGDGILEGRCDGPGNETDVGVGDESNAENDTNPETPRTPKLSKFDEKETNLLTSRGSTRSASETKKLKLTSHDG